MEKKCDQQAGPKRPANDNGPASNEPLDPRICRIAEAIGRYLAREHAKLRCPPAVNDNKPGQ